MNRKELIDLAKSYTDRTDVELNTVAPQFITLIEGRLNRVLRTLQMSARATVPVKEDVYYYGLPEDFAGLRDIQTIDAVSGETITGEYVNPKQMNELKRSEGFSYTIVADQVQIYPAYDNNFLEIVYYRKLTPLQTDVSSNWLSTEYPEIYVFALCVEISSFVKDVAAVQLWEQRFQQEVERLVSRDQVDRWSGTSLRIQTS